MGDAVIEPQGSKATFNLERVLQTNIVESNYYKQLQQVTAVSDLVDEIYEQVEHVEPWMSGNARGPSTAFNLLYRLFTVPVTVKEMHGMLKHADSPYIRAVRCCGVPRPPG